MKKRELIAELRRLQGEALSTARKRFDEAAQLVAAILDSGERDPTWHETQEFENAGLEVGRLLNAAPKRRGRKR